MLNKIQRDMKRNAKRYDFHLVFIHSFNYSFMRTLFINLLFIYLLFIYLSIFLLNSLFLYLLTFLTRNQGIKIHF